MGGLVPDGKDSGMNLGVQGLYPPVKAFRKLGHGTHIGDRNPLLHQILGGSASGKNLPVILMQKAGQLQHTIFYKNTDKGTSAHCYTSMNCVVFKQYTQFS